MTDSASEPRTVQILTICPICDSPNPIISTTEEKYAEFLRGKLRAGDITGNDTEKSEWLITGTCTPCWNKIFWMPEQGPEDDEPSGDHPDDNRPSDFGGEETEEDTDPICVCGTSRSEHSMCGCSEGFQTSKAWDFEKQFISSLTDDQFQQVYGGN